MKICNKCLIDKELDDFYKDKYKKDGYKTICINCSKLYDKVKKAESGKKYYEMNKDKISSVKKIYVIENKDRIREYQSKWRDQNKDRIYSNYVKWLDDSREVRRIKYNNKLKTDPMFKFIHNVKCNIRNGIKKSGYRKTSKTREILGVDFTDFKIYIELLFQDGMLWENYGDWHLDHKIPISWSNTKQEVIDLCHYTNYQPLWAVDNLSKGNRYSN